VASDGLTNFSRERIGVSGASVFLRQAGSGPAVLLLHGYPETHLAWRRVAPGLAKRFTVVAADLPGYGDSVLAADLRNSDRVSKRVMARVLADVMTALGVSRFVVVGHDRGARVEMAERLTYTSARQMAHWFWLAQSSTVPETLIGLDPSLYLRHIIDSWGGADAVDRDVFEEYLRCMRKPEVRAAMGAEYRADEVDLEHDRADRRSGRRIACPLLAVWAQGGLVEEFGDPIAIWRTWAERVRGKPIPGGHFLMEESPQQLSALLTPFLTDVFRSEPARAHQDEVPRGRSAQID
jgi:haloacetate dehalogenase